MFVKTKPSGKYQYLQIVESRWEDGRPRQSVIATNGRLDRLKADGQVDVPYEVFVQIFREGKGNRRLQRRQDKCHLC